MHVHFSRVWPNKLYMSLSALILLWCGEWHKLWCGNGMSFDVVIAPPKPSCLWIAFGQNTACICTYVNTQIPTMIACKYACMLACLHAYHPIIIRRSSAMHTVRSEFDHIDKTVAQLFGTQTCTCPCTFKDCKLHARYKFSMEVNEGLLCAGGSRIMNKNQRG